VRALAFVLALVTLASCQVTKERIDQAMSDAVITPQIAPGTYQGIVSGTAGKTYAPGTPLSPSVSGILLPAQANAVPGAYFCGMLQIGAFVPDLDDLVPTPVQQTGPLTLSATQWEAVTVEGTVLTPNNAYYVSATEAGMITKTAPSSSGSYVAPVGFALSTTTLLLFNQLPIGPHA
jgi:hypothetical protein